MKALPHAREELKKLPYAVLFRAVLDRRKILRTHRDQVGDDRCWIDDYSLFAFVEGLDSKLIKPDYETCMTLCTRFYENCGLTHALPASNNAITDPELWDDDLYGMTKLRLLYKLEVIQHEVVVLYNIIKNRIPIPRDYLRLYKRTLPEGIMPNMILPPRQDFLGEAKLGAGCLQFWKSHENCPPAICDLHKWGPCS